MINYGGMSLTYELDAGSTYNRLRYIHKGTYTFPIAYTGPVHGNASGCGPYPCSGICFANLTKTSIEVKMGNDTTISQYYAHWITIGY